MPSVRSLYHLSFVLLCRFVRLRRTANQHGSAAEHRQMLLETYIANRLELEAQLDRAKSRSFGNLPRSLCFESSARLLPPRVPIYYSASCSSNHSSLTADASTSNSLQTKFKPILSKFSFDQNTKSLCNHLLPKRFAAQRPSSPQFLAEKLEVG